MSIIWNLEVHKNLRVIIFKHKIIFLQIKKTQDNKTSNNKKVVQEQISLIQLKIYIIIIFNNKIIIYINNKILNKIINNKVYLKTAH